MGRLEFSDDDESEHGGGGGGNSNNTSQRSMRNTHDTPSHREQQQRPLAVWKPGGMAQKGWADINNLEPAPSSSRRWSGVPSRLNQGDTSRENRSATPRRLLNSVKRHRHPQRRNKILDEEALRSASAAAWRVSFRAS
eukprot:CAMPEP_0169473906 /NCGR_PEP_ID=MMETSP1042-20121227/25962_1 /TAXON_ID=464988 /ORGANISM="Hemiselmis andersenii, Strain CCMP1180" /LENGTH=137 /DNA_ID=CAMNT_0009587879 /DNA_START=119 /DNA_END=528 /DNA_ORIENTATION=-